MKTANIDTSLGRGGRGPNKYISQIVSDVLSEEERRELSIAYKKLRYTFTQEAGVKAINEHLANEGNAVTQRKLAIDMDMSSRSSWETAVSPHIDDLPLESVGKGEQCRIQMRLAIAGASEARSLLIEEPENHLSHTNLNILLGEIEQLCAHQQVVVTTHSAFVLNKLGLGNLKLLSKGKHVTTLAALSIETKDYFMKLPGFDTLRMILATRSILVEGPSDELIVQRAYRMVHGRLPMQDGVDVISVRALAFKRFLEIARILGLDVSILTDNDGKSAALESKYRDYLDGSAPTIKICYDKDDRYKTLEPQLLNVNPRGLINKIIGRPFSSDDELLDFMEANKTDTALSFFNTNEAWSVPQYILDAVT